MPQSNIICVNSFFYKLDREIKQRKIILFNLSASNKLNKFFIIYYVI